MPLLGSKPFGHEFGTEGTAVISKPHGCLAVSSSGSQPLTLDGLARCANVHPDLVKRFVEFGLLEPTDEESGEPLFYLSAIQCLQRITRLRGLGINLAGVSVVLDLLDKLRVLQFQNEVFRMEAERHGKAQLQLIVSRTVQPFSPSNR